MPAGGREKMRYIVNSREMNLYDSRTIEEFHMPQAVLMERAAFSFVETLRREKRNTSRTLVVCGSGNNGGDGYAIARILMQAGNTVDVLEAPHTGKASVGNQLQKKIFLAYGGKILTEFPEGKSYTLVIDAVFGVGLSRSVEGEYASLIDRMNAMEGAKAAVDIASGISADNGNVLGTAFRADLTVTFAFEKVGCLLWPGNQYAGKVVVADIGITPDAFGERKPAVAALEDADLSLLAARESHSNKGTFGRLLVIAGSQGMSGAAYLCAKAAYASGCGLVRIFTPEENRAASGGGNHGIFLQKGGGAAAFGGNELGGHDRVRTGDRHAGYGCGDGSHSDQECGGSGAFGCGRAECDCKRYKPAASAAHGTRGDAAPWRDEPADGGFGGVSAESSD